MKNYLSRNEKTGFLWKMKFCVGLLTLFMTFAYSAKCSDSQNVSLNLKNVTLGQVLSAIEAKTDYHFFYNNSEINSDKKVSINVKNKCISYILDALFDIKKFECKFVSNQIIILKTNKINKDNENTLILQSKISGKIIDKDGLPLPGANVLVKDTNLGTVTDFDGNFNLEIPQGKNILIISYLGYKTKEVDVSGKNSITVTLLEDAASLDEVVVVGYGTQVKKTVSGSVSSISARQINEVPAVSAENALIGQVSGVQIQQTSGEPGASATIRIRGTGSISAGNNPLFVVDGIPISKNLTSVGIQGQLNRRAGRFQEPNVNPLSTINPNDIANIQVLKDASAAAIYGSRGGNGVVLITTKKGAVSNKGIFSFNSYFGVQSVANKIDLMNSQEIIDYARDSRNNNYLSSVLGASINDPIGLGDRGDSNYELPLKYLNWDGTDTDWQSLIFNTSPTQSYNFSYASPVKNNTSYFISGGYYNQEGIIQGSRFERYNTMFNLVSQLSNKLKLEFRLAPTLTENNRKPANAPYFARPPGIVYSALVQSPVIKPYNADGSINQSDNQSFLGGGTTSASSPLAIIKSVSDKLFQFQTQGSLGLSYDISPELTFKTFAGTYINIYNRDFFRDNSLLYRTATEGESYAQSAASTEVNWLWENTLNWVKNYGNHHFDTVLGYTIQKDETKITEVQANNFPDDLVKTISGGQVFAGTSIKEAWSLVSALLRLNYNFKDKYLFTGTIRSDESSRFGKNNRTGYFPSFSTGWRMSQEDFMSHNKSISELKFRFSWGQTGNFEIPNSGSIGLLSPDNYNFNGNQVNGIIQSTISNPNLTWEKSSQTDIGMDLGMLNRVCLESQN